MKFQIRALYLWKGIDDPVRVMEFAANKVNVITGGTGTGKTSIMHIINYCLLSSNSKIPRPQINDTIFWYGLKFKVNEKEFFIARERPNDYDVVSNKFYFSAIGDVPQYPAVTISESELKLILEREFGVDDNIVIPFGGRYLKSGNKVSFRFFLLLNTLHEDTIADSSTFFDFKIHDEARYKEAFDRIFDLILGAATAEKVLQQQKMFDLQRKYTTLTNREKAGDKAREIVDKNILDLVSKAQSYKLVESKLFTPIEARDALRALVRDVKIDLLISPLKEVEDLKQQKTRLMLQIRNLESLKRNTEKYSSLEDKDADSLQPVELIKEYYEGRIARTFDLKFLVDALSENLAEIRENIKERTRFVLNLDNEISVLNSQVKEITDKISSFPEDLEELRGEANKYIFIGELQTLLDLYNNNGNSNSDANEMSKSELEAQIGELEGAILELQNSRGAQLSLLNEFLNNTKNSVKEMLGEYRDYRCHFNVQKKTLEFIAPGSATPVSNVGSRSNYMYMHLILMFGLHDFALATKNKHIAQFLILDQPSQPYFDSSGQTEETFVERDRQKLFTAFQMMDTFITRIIETYKEEFQIILIEHAREDKWEGLQNFHVVDDFWNGRALVM